MLFFVYNSFSQQTVKIVDVDGKSIPFVSITLTCKEKEVSFIGSEDGTFSIPQDCEAQKLKLKHIGYQTKWMDVKEELKTIVLYASDIKMETLVVTGQYTPSSNNSSVHKVTVIDSKRIEAQSAVNLQELMEQEMNIRVSQDQFLGSSMSIQGLSGENVKILIDGVPVIGRQNGGIDLSQINLNNVERIEIVEGPLAVNYGTNALAGTINVITKKAGNVSHLNVNSYYESVGQYNMDAQANTQINSLSVKVNGGRNFFDGYSLVDTSRKQDWKPKEQFYGGVQLGMEKKQWNATFTTDWFDEKLIDKGEKRAPYFETAFDDYYYTNRSNYSLQWNNQAIPNHNVSIVAGYNYYQREKVGFLKDLVNLKNNRLESAGSQDTSVFDLYMSRGSISSTKDTSLIQYQLGYDLSLESFKGARLEGEEQAIGDYAAFGSFIYKPISTLSLKSGVRYAYNTQYKAPLIPSFNILYQATEHLTLRGSYGSGFRSPSLKELYFLFVDVNHNVRGNKDLQAEISNNYMLQLAYTRGVKRGVYTFDLSAFYNKVNNQITLALVDANTQLYQYNNVREFYSKGINFKSGFRYKTYKTQFGFSYIGRYNLESETNSLVNTYSYSPEASINFIYEVEEWNTSFSLFYKYNGALLGYEVNEFGEIGQYTIPDYGMMDASIIQLFLKKKLTATVGVKNVFDVKNVQSNQSTGGVHSNPSGIIPVAWGRTFFLKLGINL